MNIQPVDRKQDLFAHFAPPIRPQSPLRQAITAAYRRDEAECVLPLIDAATSRSWKAAVMVSVPCRPFVGCCQRNRASNPLIWPVIKSTLGW